MAQHFVLKRLWTRLLIAVCLAFVFSRPVNALPTSIEMTDVCDSWDKNVADYSGQDHCWSCQIFMVAFNAGNKVAGQVCDALSDPLRKLIAIGGGLWLAFYVMAFLNNYSGPSPGEGANKIAGILFRIMIGCAMLQNGCGMVFEYLINPTLMSCVTLANEMLSITNSSLTVTFSETAESSATGPVSPDVADALKQMIEAIASSMAEGQAVAQGLRCGAPFWKPVEIDLHVGFISLFKFGVYIPNPIMWAVGALFGCLFWGIAILFSFSMLDVIFRIGLILGLLPIFVAAWVFPMFNAYAKAAWDMFLNSSLVFFITGIIASFVTIMAEQSWSAGGTNINGFLTLMKQNKYPDAWDSIFSAGALNGLGNLILVLAVILWGWCMAPKSDGTAKRILGGSFSTSCAIKAIKIMIDLVWYIIELTLAIITIGATTFTYICDIFNFLKQGMEGVQRIREFLEKVKQLKEKLKKVQEMMEKMKKVGSAAASLKPSGDADADANSQYK